MVVWVRGDLLVGDRGGDGMKSKVSAEKGMESVKTNARGAKAVDLTEREPAHN